jgi:hypothetical protein
MPLNFVNSGGGSPFIRFSVEDNEWVRSTPEGDLTPIDMLSTPVVIDIENIQQGWLALQGGRDWVEWPGNDVMKCPKPSDAHRQGISVQFYSTKLFGDESVRELCSSQVGILEFIKKLYNDAESEFGKGKVPAVKIGDATKIKIGKGNSRIPTFDIVKWVDRPDELDAGASVPSPAAETVPSAAASDDDVDFGEI